MGDQPIKTEYKLEPDFMTKKALIRAYRHHSLNPDIKVTINDYRWFNNQIELIQYKLINNYAYGRRKYGYTPREVQLIFDLLLPPTISK